MMANTDLVSICSLKLLTVRFSPDQLNSLTFVTITQQEPVAFALLLNIIANNWFLSNLKKTNKQKKRTAWIRKSCRISEVDSTFGDIFSPWYCSLTISYWPGRSGWHFSCTCKMAWIWLAHNTLPGFKPGNHVLLWGKTANFQISLFV